MAIADLSLLDARALSERLTSLAGEERNVQADFLAHLDELDRRRSFAELGYPSLWEYCLRALHLREGAAGRRIGAMRVLRRFPRLDGALRDGRLCLSTLCQLGPILTDDNVDELARRAEFKTKSEVEAIVASVKPRPVPADGLRRLPLASPPQAPAPESVRPGTVPADDHAQPVFLVAPLGLAPSTPVPAQASSPALRELPGSRPEVRAVSTDHWSLRVTLDPEAKADLEALAALLAHKIPRGDLASVLKVALRCAVETHARRKGALPPGRPRKSAASSAAVSPRAIPAAVRRAVWARDANCCTFTAPDGTRCGSRWNLELDHVVPAALGGPPTIDNLRLRCRTHNLLHAEAVFGREHMERCRNAGSPIVTA